MADAPDAPDASPTPPAPEDAFFPERAYACLFEDSPNAVVLRDPSGRIVSVNAAFTSLFGHAPEAVQHRLLADLLVPQDGRRDGPREWADPGSASQLEARRRRADGSLIEVILSYFPVSASCGPPGAFVIYRSNAQGKRNEAMAADAEKRYRGLFTHAAEGIFQTTPSGRYLDVNPALAAIYGFASPAELIERFKDIKSELYVDPARRDEFVRLMSKDGRVVQFESQVRRKDGSVIWITENARTVYDAAGAVAYYEGTVLDVTERRRAEEALAAQRAYFTQLFENSPQAIVLIDENRNVVDCNKGFESLFGYRAKDIRGFGMRPFIVPEALLTECENARNAILSGRTVERETSRRHRDGRDIPVSMIGFPVRIGDKIHGIIYIYQDISERKAFEEQISHQAFHDALTGLPNRTLFAERLERALTRCKRRPDFHYAVLMIDLNKFKAVNDSLGHQAGDRLLTEVGRRLSSCLRSVDTVARLGGDEFAVILEEFASRKEVLQVAKRILGVLSRPYAMCRNEIAPGASIGIVPRISGYHAAEDVLRDADIAMYRAKERGRGLLLFDERMRREVLETIGMEAELREVLDKGGLALRYQPIVTVSDERLEGFEALVRWPHPLRGMIPPDRFIPLAEETGLIVELGKWVISQACRDLAAWSRTMPEASALSMSVNVSIRQFAKPGLVEHVAETLRLTGIEPSRLKLEVTESVIMGDVARVVAELNRLRELGVRIAIDDFGTGYSSLSYLRQMPIDHLKIDRSFISGEDDAGENLKIIRSIISLARSLGLTVIAEGVENREQLERLRGLECDKAQGYMFSRPVDAEAAGEIIRNGAKVAGAE